MYSQTTPGEYTVKNVITNTKDSDFGTSFFGKDKVVFAAPKDNTVLTKKTWSGNNQAFLDLYIGTINEKGEIIGKKRVLGDVNGKFHEGVVSFTKDLKTVYFSANNYTDKNKAKKDSTGMVNIQLYKASVGDNGEWTNIIKLPFNNDEYSTGHPSLNIDDTKLYFISDRYGSVGKTDIYVVDVNADDTYSEPKNLGPKINTEEREMFPFISDDNVLYFSSTGHPGYGALDVFASRIFDTTVSEPINLEDPVNSSNDDFAFIINDDKHKGYFSSNNRKDGKGDDDIYSFIAFPPLQIEGNQTISGIVIDKETQKLIPEAIVVLQDENGNELERVKVSANTESNLMPSIDDLNLNNQENTSVSTGEVADIHVNKIVDNPTPKVGEDVEFTVEVTNKGTGEATEIKVSDILPEGFEYVHDDGSGTYRPETDILILPKLAAGEKTTIKIKAVIPNNDLNQNNEDNTTVATGEVADVHVNKTVDNPTPNAGEEVEFTVEVTNNGKGEATEIKVSDILPEGFEYVHDDGSGTYEPGTDILTLPKLAAGEKTTIKIKAIIPNNDLNQNNEDNTTVATGEVVDVHVNKTVDNPTPNAGEEVEFTVEVTNKGTGEATEIKVSDVLPEGYEYVHDDGSGTYDPGTDILTLPKLAAGEKTTLKIKAVIPNNDLNQNNRENITAVTGEVADVHVNKTVDNLTPKRGEEVEFTVEVTNKGTGEATEIKVSDILPEGYEYVHDDGSGTYEPVTDILTLPKLAAGEKTTIKIKAVIPNNLNQNNQENTTVATGEVADVHVNKTVDNPTPNAGEEVEFTVEVTNKGTGEATEVKVSDILPEGYEYVHDDGSGVYEPGTDILTLPKLAAGEKTTIKIKAVTTTTNLNQKNRDKVSAITGDVSDIRINKRVDKLNPKTGDEVEFTVEITNNGTRKAKGIKVSDILPEGYTYVSDDGTGTYVSTTDDITLPNLAKGETQTVKIKAILLPAGRDGSFNFVAKSDTKYKVVVIAPGYLKEETDIQTVNDTDVDPLEMNVSLAQELRVVDEKIMININTIYFDFDKWNIRPEAAKELDKVIGVMKEHPSMVIEGGSHTDSRAREAYNQKLSEKRAKSTVDYIVARGIDRSRITAKGYGELQLINNCSSFVKCTREEHQLNRRTEFVIVNDNDKFASNAATLENVKIDKKANLTFVEVGSNLNEANKSEAKKATSNESNTEESISTQSELINIPPIYFDFDKWGISDTELKQLDNVVQIMKDNPTIVVEASSHTDSKNLESYNQLLSEKRARSVVKYITSKGINPDRIIGKGYGEMKLTNHCKSFVKCTPEEQQANRRTEFKIIKM